MLPIIVYLSLIGAAPIYEVRTLDDRTLYGSLAELTSEGLTVLTDDGKIVLETEKLLGVSLKEKPADPSALPNVWIELTDGSTIVAGQYAVSGDRAVIKLLDGQMLETLSRSISSVRFQSGSDDLAGQWAKIIGAKRDGDVLVSRDGRNLDYHQGVLGGVDADVVHFQIDGENLPVKRSKVYGFVYRHSSGETQASPICRLTDVFGSQWQASKIELGNKLQLTTPSGLTFSCSPEMLVSMDFSLGKVLYLGDLKPESAAWTPFFNTVKNIPAMEQLFAPRKDQNFESNPLRLAGTEYAKGLTFRARTEMIFRLPGSFSRFKTVAGIDDSVRPRGLVRLTIRGDNNVLFDASISGADAPKPIELDLSGVHRLSILVDFADGRPGIGDHLDLCNARIVK